VPIGEWVLRTACSQARKWQDDGLPAVSIAVNVSAVQFRQQGFCALVRSVLRETGLAAQYLELELTESLLLANADVTLSVLRELKSMGLTLAIDDFGTGYSNFTSLRQFGVSKLKIDRSFIGDVATNTDDSVITAAIISMAKSLRLKVIAEGVENEKQMSFLRAHHCDEIQGYHFSKPLAVDKVAAKLRGNIAEMHAGRELAADNLTVNLVRRVPIGLPIGLHLLKRELHLLHSEEDQSSARVAPTLPAQQQDDGRSKGRAVIWQAGRDVCLHQGPKLDPTLPTTADARGRSILPGCLLAGQSTVELLRLFAMR